MDLWWDLPENGIVGAVVHEMLDHVGMVCFECALVSVVVR